MAGGQFVAIAAQVSWVHRRFFAHAQCRCDPRQMAEIGDKLSSCCLVKVANAGEDLEAPREDMLAVITAGAFALRYTSADALTTGHDGYGQGAAHEFVPIELSPNGIPYSTFQSASKKQSRNHYRRLMTDLSTSSPRQRSRNRTGIAIRPRPRAAARKVCRGRSRSCHAWRRHR